MAGPGSGGDSATTGGDAHTVRAADRVIALQTEDRQTPAIPAGSESGLGHELAPVLAEHPGQSAFGLLQHGPAALLARAVLADLATSSIDVQYYIYEDDFTGILLMQKLL